MKRADGVDEVEVVATKWRGVHAVGWMLKPEAVERRAAPRTAFDTFIMIVVVFFVVDAVV